ncbi:hypothetical protein BDW02DRAFT_107841 [Decorospora gaudefroyi]|uniref:Uncharacterized protein n=1 Tax=Decorospora gaudefroyi TaxID=184978 RepID=A0A6A5KKQ0_9PLEO|nr:hypothetical protein BDW02DRAFT_107841 [Decorospora gaudefroyi]
MSSWPIELAKYFGSTSDDGEFPFTTTENDDARRLKKSLRQFRGLTQTCRTIRREFLPLYQRRTTYRVCHLHIQEYLDTVLRKECEEDARETVEAMYNPYADCISHQESQDVWLRIALAHRPRIFRNIIIDCKSHVQTMQIPECKYGTPSYIDILPFLKFLATAPNIRVRCGDSGCKCCGYTWNGVRVHLDMLFRLDRHPKLLAWLEESVESVRLIWAPHLHFNMRKGHAKSWMSVWNRVDGSENQELKDWSREVE